MKLKLPKFPVLGIKNLSKWDLKIYIYIYGKKKTLSNQETHKQKDPLLSYTKRYQPSLSTSNLDNI
jgi:hypothetical protein